MHIVQTEIPKPTSEREFEEMCARIYGEVFGDSLPNINGRRGQAQAGIDVFVRSAEGRIGIQSKRYADGKLKISHITEEVGRADNARTSIVRLIVATTAASDSTLLREVQDLSDSREKDGFFPVSIQFWEDICRHIRGHGRLQADYAPNDVGGGIYRIDKTASATLGHVEKIAAALNTQSGLSAARADSLNKLISAQLDSVNELLKNFRYSDAIDDLRRIGSDLSGFDSHQKARWFLQRGVCIWHLDSGAAAARDFISAGELYPDDEKMAAAMIRGLFLNGELEAALSAGRQSIERFPESVYVWVAYVNARIIHGEVVGINEVPQSMRTNPDVLQVLAWGYKQASQLKEALGLIAQALDSPEAGFFTRASAMAIALEAATSDNIRTAFNLLGEFEVASLKRAVTEFEPRNDRLWPVQSPQSLTDTTVHLGYSYLVLGRPEDSLALIEESRHRGAFSSSLMRIELDALRQLDRTDEFFAAARKYLTHLGEEALVLVAETAADRGDVSLVNDVRAISENLELANVYTPDVLQSLYWTALWRSGVRKQQALEELRATNFSETSSLILLCVGAKILSAAGAEDEVEVVLQRAKTLVTASSSSIDRYTLADTLSATDHLHDAIPLYESLIIPGRHSELHNRLLACYVRTGARRKARQMLESLPEGWSNDDGTRSLAIELGQRAGDLGFLEPLAQAQCNREPDSAGSWLFRLIVDLKLKKLDQFHEGLLQLPTVVRGNIRQIAQLGSLEIRYGREQEGLARLYRCLRENQDDLEAASAYVIAVVSAPDSLPNMEESFPEVVVGSSVRLADEIGGAITVTIDPVAVGHLPPKGEFHPPADPEIAALLGVPVGASVDIPRAFGSVTRYTVQSVMSAYRRAVQYSQERISTSLKAPPHIVSVPIPNHKGSADFSHVHAMLKKQSEHSRLVFETYAKGSITLGVLAKLLGRSTVELVAAWSSDGPGLFTCIGTREEREGALHVLAQEQACYVVDAATLTELVLLKCEKILSLLPALYASTATQELLETLLEEERQSKAAGYMRDINGSMQYQEITDADRAERLAFYESLLDALRTYCKISPAYGPEALPLGFEQAEGVLDREEYEVLLLTAEKSAVLFTVDGRLAMLARTRLSTVSIWPQPLMMYAESKGALRAEACSYACVQQFLRNRSFVSLRAPDLVTMCLQGDYFLRGGLQRLKDYLASPSTEYDSGSQVALEFLEAISREFIQYKAFTELLSHIAEACLRHPACNRDEFGRALQQFLQQFTESAIGPEYAYSRANDLREAKRQIYFRFFSDSLQEAVRHAKEQIRKRPIRLKSLACTKTPSIVYDGTIVDSEGISSDLEGSRAQSP